MMERSNSYTTADQDTWASVREAMYAGPMKELLEACFPNGAPTIKLDTKRRST